MKSSSASTVRKNAHPTKACFVLEQYVVHRKEQIMRRIRASSVEISGLCANALLITLICVSALQAQVELKAVGQPMEHKFHPQMSFSPDGARLMTQAGVVWLWDVNTQKIVGDGIMGPNYQTGADRPKGAPLDADKFAAVIDARFAPDGKSVLVFSGTFLQRWDPTTGLPKGRGIRLVPALGAPSPKKSEGVPGPPAAVRPDGKVLAAQHLSTQTLAAPGKLKINSEYGGWLINTSTGKLTTSIRYEQHVKVKNRSLLRLDACAFSGDGKKLITVHGSGEVRLWDAANGKPLEPIVQLPGHVQGRKNQYALAADGQWVAAVAGGRLQLWDLRTGKLAGQVVGTGKGPALTTLELVAFNADAQMLAVFGSNAKGFEEVHLLTVPELTNVTKFRQERVRGLVFSPDGKMLLTMVEGISMKLWDAATGKLRATVKGEGAFQAATFSPDGTLLVTAFGARNPTAKDADRSRVQLWRLPDGRK
jgi:WD40 repeat protein